MKCFKNQKKWRKIKMLQGRGTNFEAKQVRCNIRIIGDSEKKKKN